MNIYGVCKALIGAFPYLLLLGVTLWTAVLLSETKEAYFNLCESSCRAQGELALSDGKTCQCVNANGQGVKFKGNGTPFNKDQCTQTLTLDGVNYTVKPLSFLKKEIQIKIKAVG